MFEFTFIFNATSGKASILARILTLPCFEQAKQLETFFALFIAGSIDGIMKNSEKYCDFHLILSNFQK